MEFLREGVAFERGGVWTEGGAFEKGRDFKERVWLLIGVEF